MVLVALVLASAAFGLAGVASACAGCGAAETEATRWWYIATTVLLSVLPLGFVGTVVFVLFKRARPLEGAPASRTAPETDLATRLD